MNLEKVNPLNNHDLRQIVVAYWQEVMPQSKMMQNPARQDAYFLERFLSTDDNLHLYWAVVAGQKVRFVAYTMDNPQALAFWEAQGFRIALYRLRQYRDPNRGQSYIGALSSDLT